MFHGCPYKFAKVPEPAGDGPPLAAYSKQVLAWTAHEATAMGDYWIDTEHLLLGIMRVKSCTAASHLARTGLTLKAARKAIKSNKLSRPAYGKVPRGWRLKSWLFKSFVLS